MLTGSKVNCDGLKRMKVEKENLLKKKRGNKERKITGKHEEDTTPELKQMQRRRKREKERKRHLLQALPC